MELARKGIFFSLAAIVFLTVLTIIIGSATREQSVDTGVYSARSTISIHDRLEQVYLPLVVRSVTTNVIVAESQNMYDVHPGYLVVARDVPSGASSSTAFASNYVFTAKIIALHG